MLIKRKPQGKRSFRAALPVAGACRADHSRHLDLPEVSSSAFFPAEHGEEVIRLCGRELRVIERVEEGAHFLLVLSSGESSGGYAEYTQRGILLVLYDAGMTAAIARQLAVGLQEYVVSDGV